MTDYSQDLYIGQDEEDHPIEPGREFNIGAHPFPDADEIDYDPTVFPPGPLQTPQEPDLLPIPMSNALRRASASVRCSVGSHLDLVLDQYSIEGPETEKARTVLDRNPYRGAIVFVLVVQCLRCGREARREMVRATTIESSRAIEEES